MFRDILNRGFKHDNGILVIADGAKGWHKAARDVFGESMVLQRCQVHKIRNVLNYLSKADQELFEILLKQAFQMENYHEAKSTLEKLADKIEVINRSVVQSLREGLEEALTLHRLKVPPPLRVSFATTNPIESIHAEIDRRLKRLKRYCNSDQKQRWVAISLIEQENHLGKVRNHTKILELQKSVQQEVLTLKNKT